MKTKSSIYIQLIIVILFSCLRYSLSAQTVLYVTQNGAGTKTGTSWANAYDGNNLQTAINLLATTSGGQVWVAMGTYSPTQDVSGNSNPTDPRLKTFSLKKNVAVYGGFYGTETTITPRTNNYCFLSGDIGVLGDASDNTYNVVSSTNVDTTAQLDHFIIINGNANGATTLLSNGGGAYLDGGYISNCYFQNNNAHADGGGMYIYLQKTIVTNT